MMRQERDSHLVNHSTAVRKDVQSHINIGILNGSSQCSVGETPLRLKCKHVPFCLQCSEDNHLEVKTVNLHITPNSCDEIQLPFIQNRKART